MRLLIILPQVNPEAIAVPTRFAYAGCRRRKFHLRQEVRKSLRDTVYQGVQVHRSQCLKRKRTFQVYPEGTTHAQTSQRVKGAQRFEDFLLPPMLEGMQLPAQPVCRLGRASRPHFIGDLTEALGCMWEIQDTYRIGTMHVY